MVRSQLYAVDDSTSSDRQVLFVPRRARLTSNGSKTIEQSVNLKNIIWNLLGLGLPLLFAVWAVPTLLQNAGAEKFGFMGLAWGLVGYASLLDLGMSRALTQKLAINRMTDSESAAKTIIKSAIYLTLVVSAVFFTLMSLLAIVGIENLINYQETTDREVKISIFILAFTLPLQALSLAFKGVNEAYLNFRGISVVRMLLGGANFAAPAVLSFWTNELHFLILTLLIARAFALLAYAMLAQLSLPRTLKMAPPVFDPQITRELFDFGKWVALSGVIQPILTQADRFVIGALISAAAVGSYVVPYEIAMQSLILMGAVTTVAFPAISQLTHGNPGEARQLLNLWASRMAVVMLALMLALALSLPTIMQIWIGSNATDTAITAGQILCAGAFAHAVGSIYTSYLHAYGKTKLTAIFHMAELALYLPILYLAVSSFGIVGAATAWTMRAIADTALLVWASRK